jgi:hypothetical protein
MSRSLYTLVLMIAATPAFATVSFTAASGSPYAVGTSPVYIASGDFNGDGRQDFAVANQGSSNITILLAQAAGGYAATTVAVTGGITSIQAVDLNGDRKLDLAIGTATTTNTNITYFVNDGTGVFTATAMVPTLNEKWTYLVAADISKDGFADLVWSGGGNFISRIASTVINNGGTFTGYSTFGSFGYGAAPSTPSAYPGTPAIGQMVAGNVTGNGNLDIVCATGNANIVWIQGNGQGGLDAPGSAWSPLPVGTTSKFIALADVNHDGKLDAIVATGDSNIYVMLGNGDGTFQTAIAAAFGGSAASGVAVGDFDGDGKLDLAVTSSADAHVYVLLGNNTGTFATPATLVLDLGASGTGGSVIARDFNGDGKTDLAVTDKANGKLYVFLNSVPSIAAPAFLSFNSVFGGTVPASQTAALTFTSGTAPGFQAVSSAAWLSATVNGTAPPTSLTVSVDPSMVTTGAFSGTLTLSATGYYSTKIQVSLTVVKPDSTLIQGNNLNFGSQPLKPVIVDLNKDGFPDVLVVSGTSVYSVKNNGNGTFSNTTNVGIEHNLMGPAIGDFNGDGNVDFVAVAPNFTSSTTEVFVALGLGTGHFANFDTATLVGLPNGFLPTAVVTGDFDGDGKTDIAVLNSAKAVGTDLTSTLSILFGDGTGGFTALPGLPRDLSGKKGIAMVVGDFNRDGKLDLAITHQQSIGSATVGAVTILLGNGDGTFTEASGSPYTTGNTSSSMVLADFDGDGNADLAIGAEADATNSITVLMGNGSGGFTSSSVAVNISGLQGLSAGDVDGDGKIDLVAMSVANNKDIILFGNGSGGFAAPVTLTVTSTAGATGYTAVADLNGDGTTDLLSTGFLGQVLNFFAGGKAPTTTTISSLPASPVAVGQTVTFTSTTTTTGTAWSKPGGNVNFTDGATTYPAGAVNASGQASTSVVITLGSHNFVASYLGDGATLASDSSGTTFTVNGFTPTLAFTTQPVTTHAGVAISPAVVVRVQQPGVGTAINYNEGITLTLTSGSFDVLATTTVNAVAGFATFSHLIIDAPGTYTLTATATGGVAQNSNSFQITAGSATHYSVTGFPNPATSGTAGSVTVTALDAGNNTATGYLGTVHFTSSDGSAQLPANYTFVAGDAGVHVFSATLKTAGTKSITATDTVTGSITGTQSAIVVNAGAATTVTPGATPQNVTVGNAYSTLTATVTDANSNPVSGQVVSFTAPASGASGTFTGGLATVTATTDATGVASPVTFTANHTAGAFNVVASLNSHTGTFALTNNPGAIGNLTIQPASDNQTAAISTAFATALAATVTDSFGNPISAVSVNFNAPGSGASGTFPGALTSVSANTDAAGKATAPAFTANGTTGSYTVSASVAELSGVFHLTNSAGNPAHLTITAGNNQNATVNTAFATQLQVNVTDAGNNPLAGLSVNFTAPGSGASGAFPGPLPMVSATTDALGNATAPVLTANTKAGGFTLTAGVAALSANFSLTNNPGAPLMTITAGNNQSVAVGSAFPVALAVTIADAFGNPFSGTSVTFTPPGSGAGGTFTGSSTVSTNAAGLATAPVFTANGTIGAYSVNASSGELSGKGFSLSNVAGTPSILTAFAGTPQSAAISTAFGTALAAKVTDAFSNPLAGVNVTFTAPGSGASGTFGASATVATNASGIATAPAFTANTVAGTYTVTAAVNALSAAFSLTNLPGAPANITPTGTPQTAGILQPFATPLSVRITDRAGNPISGLSVTFTPPGSGASAVFTGSATVITNSNGVATAPALTANGSVGAYTVTAVSGALSANFNLNNTLSVPAGIRVVSGSGQVANGGSGFSFPLVALVFDQNNQPVVNATVTFTLPAAGASAAFTGSGQVFTTTTDSLGNARTPGLSANTNLGNYTATAVSGNFSTSFNLTNVNPAATTINPLTMKFTADPGLAAPPAQDATIDGGNGPYLPSSDQSWLHFALRGSRLTVSVDQTGLAPGSYFGNITVDRAVLLVTLVVNPRPQIRTTATSLNFQYVQGGAAPAAQNFSVFASVRNFPFGIAANSSWLQATADGTSTPANVHVTVTAAGLDLGTYQGLLHITAGDATNSPVDVAVTLTVVAAAIPTPVVGALTNAASSTAGAVSGNEIISLYGTNLTCNGTTQVLVNGVSALILSAGATQINFVMPFGIGSPVGVQVSCGGAVSAPYTAQVSPSTPGIFVAGGGQVAAYNTGYTLNGPAAPAARGSVVMLFGTGFGAVNPADGNGLQTLVSSVFVTVGGQPAVVTFAGAAPGLAGVTQINVQIPAGAPTGAAVAVQVLSLITPAQTTLTIAVN